MAGQARLGDRELEMLGHVKALDDSANPEGDGLPAAERPAGTLGGCRDLAQLLLGGVKQLLTLAGALISQERVAADAAQCAAAPDITSLARGTNHRDDALSSPAPVPTTKWLIQNNHYMR